MTLEGMATTDYSL